MVGVALRILNADCSCEEELLEENVTYRFVLEVNSAMGSPPIQFMAP